jgi:hypothetical protein
VYYLCCWRVSCILLCLHLDLAFVPLSITLRDL